MKRLIGKLTPRKKILLQKAATVMCLLIALTAIPLSALTEESRLSIKPVKCIALHQGQVCYETLRINWHAEIADDYCLVSPDRKEPWHCWSATQSARWELEFENANSQIFKLIRSRDLKLMDEVVIEVAWVYKAESHRESHWRVF